mgnify:CR=1 FL=1
MNHLNQLMEHGLGLAPIITASSDGNSMSRLIEFDIQFLSDAVLTGISVLVLYFVLSYLLFNPVRDMLKKRRERIASELDEAAVKLKAADALKAEYEGKIKDIKIEADHILEAARKKAKAKEEEILENARAEAVRITARASKEIELEKKKAIDDAKQEMVNIAALMAQKAIALSIDKKLHAQLILNTLKEIGENTWQG